MDEKLKKDQAIRKEVRDFYDQIATGEKQVETSPEKLQESLGYDPKWLQQIPEQAQLGLSCGNPLDHVLLLPGQTLLDLGSGAGLDVFMARLKHPDAGAIYGVDRLDRMVQRALKVRDQKGFRDVFFEVGELTELPFADQSFDYVISNCVINLEPDTQKVYEEIFRVLRRGGRFVVSDIVLKKPLPQALRERKDLHGT
ncbi:SAM-dependent methyltransferase [Clostridiaceae bacterium JG1575]|nr:SAM-dependent methyltransferase [Clostridiaceae bacterium JG1575]